jgi:glucosyl-3-phosphoglycerate phosphatase
VTGDALPPLPVLPVPKLVLWRHGRTEWNVTGRFQGQLDPALDEAGREEVARSAPHLAAALPRPGTVVVASDLGRAVDTAAVLADALGVPLLQDPRLREHGMGCWEGLTRAEVAERYPDQYAAWIGGRPVEGRGGEDPAAVGERAVAALADLPAADVAVVVTHGGTAGRLLERLLSLAPHQRRIFGPLDNCAWSELIVQGSRWRLMRHNVSALPAGDGHPGSAPGRGGSAEDVRPEAGASPEEGGPAAVSDADAVV